LLDAELVIPNATSPIAISADLKTRTIKVGMRVEAPQDKQRGKARVNWLLRQLSHDEMENLYVKLIWPTRTKDTICSLREVREDPTTVLEEGHGQPPRAFEIFHVTDDVRRFSGRKTFIEDLESVVPTFYDQVGQYLQTWRPKPPKPAENVTPDKPGKAASTVSKETSAETKPQSKIDPGNRHAFLLEIPSFFKRS
jgi:hypothetical protein